MRERCFDFKHACPDCTAAVRQQHIFAFEFNTKNLEDASLKYLSVITFLSKYELFECGP